MLGSGASPEAFKLDDELQEVLSAGIEAVLSGPAAAHFPPGTSKWNTIEHRLFSAITSNWRGRPLTSHEVVVELIGATTTRTGLTVHAEVDTNTYPRGLKVSDAEMAAIRTQIEPDQFHREWNYTLRPRTPACDQVTYVISAQAPTRGRRRHSR